MRLTTYGPAPRRLAIVLTWLAVAALLGSSAAKFAQVPAVVSELARNGVAGANLIVVAVLEATSALLFAFGRTRALGLLFASAFMGGAIATHLEHGQSPVGPAVVLAVFW